jgi:hypothetical protein
MVRRLLPSTVIDKTRLIPALQHQQSIDTHDFDSSDATSTPGFGVGGPALVALELLCDDLFGISSSFALPALI